MQHLELCAVAAAVLQQAAGVHPAAVSFWIVSALCSRAALGAGAPARITAHMCLWLLCAPLSQALQGGGHRRSPEPSRPRL